MSSKGSELAAASEVKTSDNNTGKKIDQIEKILEDREDVISTDDDAYWDDLKDIEDSAFDESNENDNHTFFTKFALGLNQKDQPKDIIDGFSKLIKSIMKKIYVEEKSRLKDGEDECSSDKSLRKRKWNNITTKQFTKSRQKVNDDSKIQGLEKVIGFKRI